ncbi:glycosyltransferase [Chryseolinea sp. T2]|uniref:glycosyltransferase n=1 Tax=Chryseolinea sp. T2 TaxID=3129255 RepID=UPI0030771477
MLKVVHVSTLDSGGAGIACLRLHDALRRLALIESSVIVKNITSFHEGVHRVKREEESSISTILDKIAFRAGFRRIKISGSAELKRLDILKHSFSDVEYFSLPSADIDITQTDQYKAADIVHLHWVADFLDYASFFAANRKPVVWTLHDIAPFSGGLHYEGLFIGADDNGHARTRTLTKLENEILNRNLQVKVNALRSTSNIHVVALNEWMREKVASSAALGRFPHYIIPNGISPKIFNEKDKLSARKVFGLPTDKVVAVFVAESLAIKRKGFELLVAALEGGGVDDLFLCTVGGLENQLSVDLPHLSLGKITDERLMSLVYAAADVFIIPSLEDNLPNTMLEALMTGTPVVGYAVGGISESIADGVNGVLSKELSIDGLRKAIKRFFTLYEKFDRSAIAADAVRKYNSQKQADNFSQLYEKILSGENP